MPPTAMGLLVLDVHQRDVVAAMVHSGVVNADSFEWLKQLQVLLRCAEEKHQQVIEL